MDALLQGGASGHHFHDGEYVVVLVFVLGYFCLCETYAPVILQARKTSLAQKGGKKYRVDGEDSSPLWSKLLHASQRPLRILFTQPVVLIMSAYQAVIFSTMYSLCTNFQDIWSDRYGFSTVKFGLTYLGPALGFLLAVPLLIPYIDKIYNSLADSTEEVEWKARVPPAIGECWCSLTTHLTLLVRMVRRVPCALVSDTVSNNLLWRCAGLDFRHSAELLHRQFPEVCSISDCGWSLLAVGRGWNRAALRAEDVRQARIRVGNECLWISESGFEARSTGVLLLRSKNPGALCYRAVDLGVNLIIAL